MNLGFKKFLLSETNASACQEIEHIQSLWSGYGKISRYELSNSVFKTVVVKQISLQHAKEHPRGWNTDTSHLRKVKSYEVETYWYQNWNKLLSEKSKTPEFIGAFSIENEHWIILEDLDYKFPLRKDYLSIKEVKVCLNWLANFHASFINIAPKGLWQVGTYWHLETRPDELEKIKHKELQSKAHLIDEKLNACSYKTIVHGDAKVANFCFSENADQVAAVDFQYVGAGCGMKDVAYLLGSCLSSRECIVYEAELLAYYFSVLQNALTSNINANELEQEWRQLYPYAIADFTRFLMGWMPRHQKVNAYHLNKLKSVLKELS